MSAVLFVVAFTIVTTAIWWGTGFLICSIADRASEREYQQWLNETRPARIARIERALGLFDDIEALRREVELARRKNVDDH